MLQYVWSLHGVGASVLSPEREQDWGRNIGWIASLVLSPSPDLTLIRHPKLNLVKDKISAHYLNFFRKTKFAFWRLVCQRQFYLHSIHITCISLECETFRKNWWENSFITTSPRYRCLVEANMDLVYSWPSSSCLARWRAWECWPCPSRWWEQVGDVLCNLSHPVLSQDLLGSPSSSTSPSTPCSPGPGWASAGSWSASDGRSTGKG